MPDIFDQFENKPKLVKNSTEAEDGADYGDPRAYLAFHSVDKRQYRLRVFPVGDVSDRLPYRMLMRIMEKGRDGTAITLVYSFMAVLIEGHGLGAVANAIEKENCVFVEEFDPARHDRPADPNAPFIERITLFAPPGMETMGQGSGKKVRQEEPA